MLLESKFDKFFRLKNLSVQLMFPEGGPYITTFIYGNGKHQVKMLINVLIADRKGNPLDLTEEDLDSIVYIREAKSNKAPSSSWIIRSEDNGYYEELIFETPKNIKLISSVSETPSKEEGVVLTKFISCVDSVCKVFYVGINIPGIGNFDTSKTGTKTPNSPPGEPGVPYNKISEVEISSINRFCYDRKEYIKFSQKPSPNIQAPFGWTSRLNGSGPYKEHTKERGDTDYGITKKIILKIAPAPETGKNNVFKVCCIEEDTKSKDWNLLSNSKIWWSGDDPNEDCFKINTKQDHYISPLHISGRSSSENYELNIWYKNIPPRPNTYDHILRMSFLFYLQSTSYYYRCCPFIEDTFENESDTLTIYKFILSALAECPTYGWNDNYQSEYTLRLEDKFGNQGKIKLIFNNNNFDRPDVKWVGFLSPACDYE